MIDPFSVGSQTKGLRSSVGVTSCQRLFHILIILGCCSPHRNGMISSIQAYSIIQDVDSDDYKLKNDGVDEFTALCECDDDNQNNEKYGIDGVDILEEDSGRDERSQASSVLRNEAGLGLPIWYDSSALPNWQVTDVVSKKAQPWQKNDVQYHTFNDRHILGAVKKRRLMTEQENKKCSQHCMEEKKSDLQDQSTKKGNQDEFRQFLLKILRKNGGAVGHSWSYGGGYSPRISMLGGVKKDMLNDALNNRHIFGAVKRSEDVDNNIEMTGGDSRLVGRSTNSLNDLHIFGGMKRSFTHADFNDLHILGGVKRSPSLLNSFDERHIFGGVKRNPSMLNNFNDRHIFGGVKRADPPTSNSFNDRHIFGGVKRDTSMLDNFNDRHILGGVKWADPLASNSFNDRHILGGVKRADPLASNSFNDRHIFGGVERDPSMLGNFNDRHILGGVKRADPSMSNSFNDRHIFGGVKRDTSMFDDFNDRHIFGGVKRSPYMSENFNDRHIFGGVKKDLDLSNNFNDRHVFGGVKKDSALLNSFNDRHILGGVKRSSS